MRKSKNLQSIDKLIEIMDELRLECPWDKEQTMDSLKTLTIEETYELVDAINNNDFDEIKNELGDLLLHIVFYSKIASEKNIFDFNDVVESISKKLIYRHPHVYQNKKNISQEQVKKNWEKLKLKEGHKSILSGVPKTLPSLIKAVRIQDKVSNAGFKWDSVYDSKNKVIEEFNELSLEIENSDKKKIEEEFGDFLFSVINYGRFLGINSENALEKTNRKFSRRFKEMEAIIKNDNLELDKLSTTEMLGYWNNLK
ncbi:nucleoside triphosphate pyrophosphohydrolase [Flavobacteriaceae bacterium]|nr:nucleoside triphosphate pyrophosphohydrolase [Flavobacteriaceae bacterium]MDA9323335.1 nucleoside triphosphate pyrophosphohydrolase [Flavobacteriaceae bacterium]MDA9977618.1 nucleoside triphosphate pyrophosphohydrolase [Flavobacteriaceae bacterium]MDB4131148.1 nucleoside triphosphate pyrophosphohydrolase [Flavobacteriaceae bacterium]